MLPVHLRITDAATGRPTPVRLRITGPDGTAYPPLGRFAEFPSGRNEDVGGHLWVGKDAWCFIDGSCEVPLPADVPLRVQATKGPEYRPLDETVPPAAGRLSLRFTVQRWSDVRKSGWYPGDGRCHFVPPHAALLEAAAEDLDIVNLLATVQPFPSQDGTAYPTTPHLTAFSGQVPALEAEGRLVAVNTLNTHPVFGAVALLHSHRPVFPLSFGGDDCTDDWSVCDWCDQCHRKGGLTVWVDAFRKAGGLTGGEALVAAILGKIDALEIGPQPQMIGVYRLWNAGYRLPLIGASGKDRNRVPLGAMRTYAHVSPSPLTYRAWIEAVRAGQSFVTNGPLLSLETINASGTRMLRATAASITPFDRLEVIADGEVIATTPATGGPAWSATQEVAYPAANIGWVAARVVGSGSFAHTSLVAVGPVSPQREQTAKLLTGAVREVMEWAETHGRYANPKRKTQFLDRCRDALARLPAI